ncbi:MAG TPA: hypothetical protein VF576_08960, partial [Rubricoccaceae bacterium]
MFSDRDRIQASEVEDLTTAVLDTLRGGLVVLDEDPRVRAVNAASSERRDVVEGYGLGAVRSVREPVTAAEFGGAVRQLGLYRTLLNHPAPLDRPGQGHAPSTPR